MIKSLRYYILLSTLCVPLISAKAQNDSVMQSVALQDVVVESARNTLKVKDHADGQTVIDTKLFNYLPQILGTADPIRYSQLLPEIQTNGELRGGINMQGCENSHNIVSLAGIPIYNANHLLGFFSTFNSSHFDSFSISKMPDSKSANRLGGQLSMELPEMKMDSLTGECSVGMISSQGTLRIPLGKQTLLKTSARVTYMNLLYGHWLNSKHLKIGYSFYDANLTLIHKFNQHNSIIFDYYGGSDNARFQDPSYTAKIPAKWGNQVVGLHHLYNNSKLKLKNTLYLTTYHNKFSLNMQEAQYWLPANIFDVGLNSQIWVGKVSGGMEVIYHDIKPQSLHEAGTSKLNLTTSGISNQTVEMSVFVQYLQPISQHIVMDTGIRGNLYRSPEEEYFYSADPSVSLKYNNHNTEVFAGYSLKHQYLFQTGFSDAGLPTEYWMSASKSFPSQYAHSVNVGTSTYVLSRKYRLSANLFYKRLFNQIEYFGSILDLINPTFNLSSHLLSGDGQNYGFSATINKCSGKLTGWVSYTYTNASRKFERQGTKKKYPASHERPHEVNAVMTYDFNNHWSFGPTFVWASGTPFTAANYLALINRNIISNYREHNSNRLSPYCRLDLSANYKWKGRFTKENGINLSVYNATGRNNELFYHLSTHSDGRFSYKPTSFITEPLPSLSFFCKF